MSTTKVTNDLLETPAEIISTDTTIAVASSGGDHTTLKAAYDSLKGKRIAPDVQVDITIAEETIQETDAIYFGHPDGDRILIRGLNTPATKTIVACNGVASGGQRDWHVQFQLNDASGISVGDFVIIHSTTASSGNAHYIHRGCWEVTNVNSGYINVRNTYQYATYPSAASNGNGGTVIVLKSVVAADTTAGTVGHLEPHGHVRFQNLALVTAGKAALQTNGGGFGYLHLYQCGVNGAKGAAAGTGGYYLVNLQGHGKAYIQQHTSICASSGVGLYVAYGGQAVCNGNNGFSGNFHQGINAYYQAHVYASSGDFCGNWNTGIFVAEHSFAIVSNAHFYDNGQAFGSCIYALGHSTIYANGALSEKGSATTAQNFQATNRAFIDAALSQSNGGFTQDYDAWRMGAIRMASATGGTNCNPTVNTRGNNESYVFNT